MNPKRPNPKRPHKDGTTAMEMILAELPRRPMTIWQMHALTRRTRATLHKTMGRMVAAGLAHVASYTRSKPKGPHEAIYAAGPGKPAENPGQLAEPVRCQRWRAKKRHAALVAKGNILTLLMGRGR